MSNILPMSHGLPPTAATAIPSLTPDLDYAIDRVLDPRVGVDLGGFKNRDRAEAARVLPHFEALCRPAGFAVVREWLTAVVLSVANPPLEEEFEQRVRIVTEACEELPAAVWSPETRRLATREWKFWPTPAEVFGFLRPKADKLLRTRDALRTIATSTPAKPPAPEASAVLDPEQREQILAKFHADLQRTKAEVDTARDPAPARAPLPDVCLKGEALAESRRRRGIVPKDPAKAG